MMCGTGQLLAVDRAWSTARWYTACPLSVSGSHTGFFRLARILSTRENAVKSICSSTYAHYYSPAFTDRNGNHLSHRFRILELVPHSSICESS